MTKVRDPLTFENALVTIAGRIGWSAVAKIAGYAKRTVRNWSDPDTSAKITLDAALELDLAFQSAGGEGSPMLQCYALRLQADSLAAMACRERLLSSIAATAREHGEAISASIEASRPGADLATIAIAERELEESIGAATNTLGNLRAVRGSDVSAPGGKSQDVA